MDPVPGGCNLHFNTKIAPYQIVFYNDDYIEVESQAPSAYGVDCGDNKIQVDMYHMFLNEYDNKVQPYFDAIIQMITVDNIKLHGRKIPPGTEFFKYRRLYSSYRGTGEVFAIVATYNNRSSAYVPAVSYGCDLTKWDESCVGPGK
ncbi:hypothetical protein NQ314_002477 [Rhamnusium bicolor]|uniref:Uncharacterized protein n=1 Tax=Rhamnusium bicolor TaxID=1586634 RepID=A0AAV8ZPD2_9CUCU|nr:hypothetical protein NQ314_002477 [Rhamnusium bicolor]